MLKRIFSTLLLFFYMLIVFCLSFGLLFVALNSLTPKQIDDIIKQVYYTQNLRILAGVSAGFTILTSLLVTHILTKKLHRERTIAFYNPDGEVTISLSAVEDLIKKIAMQLHEVKELKADVRATRKGIFVNSRAILYSNINIPETTEKIQYLVRSKIQEMLGIEETIKIKIHVKKLITPNSESQKV